MWVFLTFILPGIAMELAGFFILRFLHSPIPSYWKRVVYLHGTFWVTATTLMLVINIPLTLQGIDMSPTVWLFTRMVDISIRLQAGQFLCYLVLKRVFQDKKPDPLLTEIFS